MGYPEDVQEAVRNPDWQEFRRFMKGRRTVTKLRLLWDYYRFEATGSREVVDIQVDNYIKALCRGGQLFPGESLRTFVAEKGELTVRKEC